MPAIKRALLYIFRNKGKSILIFVLLFCLAFSFVLGFCVIADCTELLHSIVNNSSVDSYDITRNRVDTYSSIGNTDEALPNVSGRSLTTRDVDQVYDKFDVLTHNAYKKVFMDTSLELFCDKTGENNAYFYAVNETKLHDFFRNGAFELISGRHIEREDENVCVISEDLADLNNLKVGDHVYPECTEDMVKPGGDENNVIVEAYPMEIVGIYKMNFEYAAPDDVYAYELPQNMIFADHISTKLWQTGIFRTKTEFYLDSIDEYEKITFFVNDSNVSNSNSMQLYTTWSVSENESDYLSIKNVSSNINIYAVCTAVAVLAVIIFLLCLLSFKIGRSRSKESGALLSYGIEKKQVFAQRFLETGIIALIAFVIALVLVSLLIIPVSDGIKAADAARVFEPYTYEYIRAEIQFGPQITQNGYLPEDFEISMNSAAIVWGIVIVFAVTVISALISSSSVLKKKTLDIVIAKENECT